jgi:hypothetical protein
MPESESFDAFYARTVWSVTSQMHALAGEDSAADHAIREAYARAYQQWYEIADNPDTESWVLAVAKEAYQRRRPEADPRPATPPARGHDSLSWPGLYRPRTPAGTPADSAATIGGPMVGMAAAPTFGAVGGPTVGMASPPAADLAGRPTAGGIGLVSGPPAGVTAALPGADQALGGRPGPPGQPRRRSWSSSRRSMVALTAAIAVIVAGGVVYLTTRGLPARRPAQHNTAARNQGPVMLPAGKTGSRSAIPWSIVGSGWTLAEVSSASAGASQPGSIITYLVDPEGGRYQIQASSPGAVPQLLAWSGNTQNALLAVPSGGSGANYELLSLTTGDITSLPLPANVTAVGFTRPDGYAILAVRENPDAFKLQRYTLQGGLQATIGSLPRKPVTPDWLPGCGSACGALSSPDGTMDVWGVTGDEMQLVGNAGGKVTKLTVPGSASCVPLTWQDTTTVLASCSVTSPPSAAQLWLVPADGSAPVQLTQPSGTSSGDGDLVGAWQAAGTTYATQVNFNQCPGAPSRPGGLAVVPLSGGSLQQALNVHGATNNHTSIVSVSGGKLLVLAQTGCPGTSSLLTVDPSTGASTTVLAGQPGQVGVLAAVPYGTGPTATNGQ